jgi:hypothetical protein
MREVNVYVNGRVVATCPDEIAARYEGQHWYSEGRKGGTMPEIGYTARYVMPHNELGVQDVVELPIGSKEDEAQQKKHDAAVVAFAKAAAAAKEATANAAKPGR